MKIDIEKVKRPSKRSGRTIDLHIKISPKDSKFLKANHISPTLLFDEAVKALEDAMWKKVEKKN